MGAWNELLEGFDAALQQDPARADKYLIGGLREALAEVGRLRGGRHVLLYGSAFLQKPQAPATNLQLTQEDLNGFMSTIYGMDWDRGLTLVLHTPGGQTIATETVVDYLRSKFEKIEIIVPAIAMSAGTMIALGSDHVVMGRQSQLGPIDPQMPIPATGRTISARAIVDQWRQARDEIIEDRAVAHAWAPIISTLGHGLLVEAQNALDYGEEMVTRWLTANMFGGDSAGAAQAASHFNAAEVHKSHGRRISREEAQGVGISIEDLEDRQELQEAVLTAYHLMTIIFEKTPATRLIASDTDRRWVKSWLPPQ